MLKPPPAATDMARELLRCPVALAYVATAFRSGLTAAQALEPRIGMRLAAVAVDYVSPHAADHAEIVARLHREVPQLTSLAREIAFHSQVSWWFEAAASSPQIWQGPAGLPPARELFIGPKPGLLELDHAPEKCGTGLFTTAEINGITSVLAAQVERTGEYLGPTNPVFWSMTPARTASVYEIRQLDDWRDLCLRYPKVAADRHVYPDWVRVAQDWDGVHLTLGGLLLTQQVSAGHGPQGRIGMVDGWDLEQTMWLRWVFESVDPWRPAEVPHVPTISPPW